MRNKTKSMLPARLLAMLVLITIVLSASSVSTLQAQTNSVPSSTPSAIPVDSDAGLRRACGETIDELKAARKLLAAQGTQIEKQDELLALEKQISAGLKDLRTLDGTEKQALRDAVAAADKEITALKGEVAVLKKQRMTFWKKLEYVLIGVGVGVIVATVRN